MREDGHLVIELPDLIDTEGRALCYKTPLEALRVRSRGLLLLPAAAAHSELRGESLVLDSCPRSCRLANQLELTTVTS